VSFRDSDYHESIQKPPSLASLGQDPLPSIFFEKRLKRAECLGESYFLVKFHLRPALPSPVLSFASNAVQTNDFLEVPSFF
jgi:hypothetical protein